MLASLLSPATVTFSAYVFPQNPVPNVVAHHSRHVSVLVFVLRQRVTVVLCGAMVLTAQSIRTPLGGRARSFRSPVGLFRQRTVSREPAAFIIAAAIATALVALAYLVAPRACGVAQLYTWCSGAALLLLLRPPFVALAHHFAQVAFAFGFLVFRPARGLPDCSRQTSVSFAGWGTSG